jgi:hypothetical protein
MYAMSVSPLSKEVLDRIDPDLFAGFAGDTRFGGKTSRGTGVPPKGERLKKPRDYTHSIKIGDEAFEIETVKGKKEVILPWEQLARICGHIRENRPKDNYYKGLKGTIVINGGYTLLAGEKLDLILSLVPSLDVDGALDRQWPRKNTFNSHDNLPSLLEELPKLVCPAPWKKGGGKALGFICLFTDGEGNYWFKCSRGFHTSLNESLSSLETLIDELGDEVAGEKKHIVNQVYRRLSNYLS